MERLDDIHESELSVEAFERFPIWVWDDKQEGYHPLSGLGALPMDYPTLFVRAIFTTASGRRLLGYLMGRETYFGFGLFIAGSDYLVNFNLSDFLRPVLDDLADQLGESALPLHYVADVPSHLSVSGRFDRI